MNAARICADDREGTETRNAATIAGAVRVRNAIYVWAAWCTLDIGLHNAS